MQNIFFLCTVLGTKMKFLPLGKPIPKCIPAPILNESTDLDLYLNLNWCL